MVSVWDCPMPGGPRAEHIRRREKIDARTGGRSPRERCRARDPCRADIKNHEKDARRLTHTRYRTQDVCSEMLILPFSPCSSAESQALAHASLATQWIGCLVQSTSEPDSSSPSQSRSRSITITSTTRAVMVNASDLPGRPHPS
jgi:hypothetical protein